MVPRFIGRAGFGGQGVHTAVRCCHIRAGSRLPKIMQLFVFWSMHRTACTHDGIVVKHGAINSTECFKDCVDTKLAQLGAETAQVATSRREKEPAWANSAATDTQKQPSNFFVSFPLDIYNPSVCTHKAYWPLAHICVVCCQSCMRSLLLAGRKGVETAVA